MKGLKQMHSNASFLKELEKVPTPLDLLFTAKKSVNNLKYRNTANLLLSVMLTKSSAFYRADTKGPGYGTSTASASHL